MSGIALIIPGADFSGSPLGTVTPKKTSAEIVDEYLANVGASVENRGKLITLYSTLSELGVIDMIDLFPMLGTSVSDRIVGLKPQGDEYSFSSLVVGNNASVLENNGIHFSDSESIVTEYGEKKISVSDTFYVFARMNALRVGAGDLITFAIGDDKSGAGGLIELRYASATNQVKFSFDRGEIAVDMPSYDVGTMHNIIGTYNYNQGFYTVCDGELIGTVQTLSSDYPIWLKNRIGAESISKSHFFNGDVTFFALGQIPNDKVSAVNTAISEYLS